MDHAAKIRLLTAGRDLDHSTGIEIGARDAPLIRRDHGKVLYADHARTDELRAALPPSIDPASLVEVDIVTGGGKLSDHVTSTVDYIVASHVAEHVPDILGWLGDLHKVLAPQGTIGLAVPDRRFTFDLCRAESTVAEAVEAYLLASTQPSLRQVFDSAWQSVDVSVRQCWDNDIPETTGLAYRMTRLAPAMHLVRALHQTRHYNDAHCWVFTPASFLDLVEQACHIHLFPFVLDVFHPTEMHGYEFFAVLRRAEVADDPDIRSSIGRARRFLANWAPEHAYAAAHLSPEIAALRADNEKLHHALHTMRQSTSWKITTPLRKAAALIRKRGP
jgi:hypothetical protein